MPDGGKHSGSQRLARGATVGSFTVLRFMDGCPLGERYEVEAVDGGRRATAFCVSSSADSVVRAQLGTQIGIRTGMIHKNLVGCIEAGQDQGLLYLIEEQSNFRTLVEHLDRRREVSRPFDAKEAYNVIAHVANGLQYAHERGDHDQLRAGAVYIQSSGRVQIAEWGLGALRQTSMARTSEWPEWDRGYFVDDTPGVKADLAALALLTYQMLTLTPAEAGLRQAMDDRPEELPPALLAFLNRATDPDERAGIATAGEFKRALKVCLRKIQQESAAGAERTQDSTQPPPVPTQAILPDMDELSIPTGSFNEIADFSESGTQAESLRWLVSRDGREFGPYTHSQILAQVDDEVLTPQSVVRDIETDQRKPLVEFPEFESALFQFMHVKDKRDNERRVERAETEAKFERRILTWGSVALIVLVLLVVGGWRYHLSTLPEPVRGNVATLVAAIEWPLPVVALAATERAEPRSKSRRGKRRRAADSSTNSPGDERARMRREERLAENSELVLGAGDGAPFDRGEFDRVVAGRMKRLYGCLTSAVQRNPSLKAVHVSLAVIPTGELINVKAKEMTSAGQRCVRRAFRGARVSPFDGVNVKITLPYRFE